MSFNQTLSEYVADTLRGESVDPQELRRWLREIGYGGGRTTAILQALDHAVEFLKCRSEVKNIYHRVGGVGRITAKGHTLVLGGPVIRSGLEMPASFSVEVIIDRNEKITHDGQYAAGVTHINDGDNEFVGDMFTFINGVSSAIDSRYDLYGAQRVIDNESEFEACWFATPELATPMGIEVRARAYIDRAELRRWMTALQDTTPQILKTW